MSLIGGLLPWVEERFFIPDPVTGEWVPNDGGLVSTRATDLTTLKAAYTTQDVDPSTGVAHTNPIVLDADGRPPDPIYLAPGGYSIFVYDSASVLQYSIPYVADVGETQFYNLGNTLAEGSQNIAASPYNVTTADNTISIDSTTDPFIVQLPAASDRTGANGNGLPLTVINLCATATVRVTPAGADTINYDVDGTSYKTIAASGTRTLTLKSDGVSNWSTA